MDIATTIALIALLVSGGSLCVTLWATRISKRSLNHAIELHKNNEEKEFERIRSDLLIQIADNLRLLDKTRIEIGTLKTDFDAEPRPVKMMMGNYTEIFTGLLPRIESSMQQLDILWQDVSGWSKEKSHSDLMDAKTILYRRLKDGELVYDSGIYCVKEFKEQLQVARKRNLPNS